MDKASFFRDTPIIGMIHLSGRFKAGRAILELNVFEEEGLDGVIVENYHGSDLDVREALKAIQEKKRGTTLEVGVNILPNRFDTALSFANRFGGSFIQLDYVAGRYAEDSTGLEVDFYARERAKSPDVIVLGGVWPKYYTPITGSDLERDLQDGMSRADAIVVTGEGTGKETPLGKMLQFRRILGNYPLIVGAGLTPQNAREQLLVADGAIVGSYFKPGGNTRESVDRKRVREFMAVVREVREEKKSLQS